MTHQMNRQSVFNVVTLERVVVLENLSGENQAQLLNLCLKFLRNKNFELRMRNDECAKINLRT
jgi:hypothetical protein